MKFPVLNAVRRERQDTTRFYGLEHTDDVRRGAFYDMCNLSADGYPLLKTRPARKRWVRSVAGTEQTFSMASPVTAAANINGSLCWCTDTQLYLGGAPVEGLTLSSGAFNRRILHFGRNLFIVPDGKYIETDTGGVPAVIHAAFSVVGNLSVHYEHAPEIETQVAFDTASDTQPDNVFSGLRWLDTSGDGLILRVYDEALAQTEIPVYLTVAGENVGGEAAVGDTVFLAGLGSETRRYTVSYVQNDKLWLKGGYTALTKETYALTLEKRMPVLDYAVEHNNRIWGCRYGQNAQGVFVNEIYACSLGDPTSWEKFDGLSTDSFVSSLGCAGAFTGAAVLGDDVLFFKENDIIRVSGSVPADFTVQVIPARGLEKNAAASCVNLNEKIFYKSASGITVYDGSLPVTVSRELGARRFTDMTAAAFNGKYYLAAGVAGQGRSLYVYDTASGLWHKEDDNLNVRFFVTLKQNLFMLCKPDASANVYQLVSVDGTFADEAENLYGGSTAGETYGFEDEAPQAWFALTGTLGTGGGTRILRRLVFRLELAENASFTAELFCNGSDKPVRLCRLSHSRIGAFSVPVNTPRCHTYRLRLSGTGACTLYSVSEITEPLSEVNGFGK
ncbi:MAG: hypothetical protein IJT27_00570 [Clostridia bacterium]|nr:hypothetical protein [Clostridia bacterium]